MCKISVIMSVYNDENFIKDTIDSILGQTYTNFEFIIINDGSTDDSQKIIEEYTDKRIKVFNRKNHGLTKSLNFGIINSEGDFIARIDSGDLAHSKKLEKQIEYLKKFPDITLLGTFVYDIDKNGVVVDSRNYSTFHNDILLQLMKKNIFCHSSIIVKKKELVDIGCYDEKYKYSQDYDLWLRISFKHKVAILPEYLTYKRYDKNMISIKYAKKQALYSLIASYGAFKRNQFPLCKICYLFDIRIIKVVLPGFMWNFIRNSFCFSGKVIK